MKIVFFSVVVFLAIIGISHIVFELFYRLIKIKDDHSVMILIPHTDKMLDAEFTVRSIIAKLKKLGKNPINNIVVISDDLDKKTMQELSFLQKDHGYLQILTKEEFKEKAGL